MKFSKTADLAFTGLGFTNWKKATEKFTDDKSSSAGRKVQLKYASYMQNENVRAGLHELYRVEN